jgi:diadenosine tetraphosphate (Ap4A) HIT family hydrolase
VNQDLFSSGDAFREAFGAGLARLLRDEGRPGPFILVLANAVFDARLYHRLRPQLARRFRELADGCRRELMAGRRPRDPEDDFNVFLKLMAIGFEHLEPGRTRLAGPWELQFNQVRSLRPERAAGRLPTGICAPFDADGFQFNRPFLRRETFWSGNLRGSEVDLLFNKFPFVDLHTLLVPEREANEPQYLTRDRHLWAWELAEHLAPALPGVGLGYNAYGAFASVNHLHFQMFLRERLLPVAEGRWRHNGGTEPFPACCEPYQDPDTAWKRIADLHEREIAYNLIYLPARLYCLPRRLQGSYDLPAWCAGQAWYELAGGTVAYNADDYQSLAQEDIECVLAASARGICA